MHTLNRHPVCSKIILFSLLLILVACRRPNGETSIQRINLEKAFEQEQAAPFEIGNLVTDVEYIPLETHDSCLVGNNVQIYADKDYIVTMTRRQIFLFDRKNGRFIKEIAGYGEAPDNYTGTNSIFPLNEQQNTITVYANNKRRTYDFEGNICRETIQPSGIFEAIEIASGIYAGFIPNFSNNEENKIALFDEKGNITGGFTNFNQALPADNNINIWKPNGWFYTYQDEHYFYELFTDTIFQITPTELIPRLILFQGMYLPPYEKKNTSFRVNDFFMLKSVFESDQYLFYTFSYQEKVYVMVYNTNDGTLRIDNLSAASFTLSYINSENELVGFIEPYDVNQWAEINSLTKQQRKPLEEINEMNNPIVVIGKLK